MNIEIKRNRRSIKTIDIAPLVDIVFLLLVFFMVSADFMKPVLRLALPKLKTEDNLQKLDIIIALDREGRITLNRERIKLANLEAALEELILKKKQKEIIFRGDNQAFFGRFTQIMDAAKSAGAESFSIEHLKQDGK